MLYYGHNYVNMLVALIFSPVLILNWWKGKPSGSIACTKTLMDILTTRKTTNTDTKHKLF